MKDEILELCDDADFDMEHEIEEAVAENDGKWTVEAVCYYLYGSFANYDEPQKVRPQGRPPRAPVLQALIFLQNPGATTVPGFFHVAKSDKTGPRKTRIIGVHPGCIALKTEFWGA